MGLAQGGYPFPPYPLFVNFVDFRGFRVGAGEDNLQEPLDRFFMFSVFLCDFRVMMRPSKRIPYKKPKYNQKIHNSNPGFTRRLPHAPSAAHPHIMGAQNDSGRTRRLRPTVANQIFARKHSVCSAKAAHSIETFLLGI
jgi:hypothetical protein